MIAGAAEQSGPLCCSNCGRSSTLRSAFTHGRDGTRKRIWCPLCLGRYQEKISTVTLLSLAVAVVFAIINLNYGPSDPARNFVAAFLFAYLAFVLMVLPHELGHALVGLAMGFTPVSIVVGEGRLLFDRALFGVRLRIGRTLRGGATYLDVREAPHLKLRMILMLAAGPVVNLAAGIAAIVAALPDSALGQSPMWRAALLGFGAGNLIMALSSLWPRTARSPLGPMPTDGAQILAHLVGVPMELRTHRAFIHLVRAMHAYADRDYESAKRETAAAESFSDHVELTAEVLALRAEAFSESGEPRAAMELLGTLRGRDDLGEESRVKLDQAYAWAALLSDEPMLREDALVRIARCTELEPWSDVVLIKHVSLLAASATANPGRVAEARRLLETLRDFRLAGESLGYARLATGLVALAEGNPGLARAEYIAAGNARVSPTALRLLESRLAIP